MSAIGIALEPSKRDPRAAVARSAANDRAATTAAHAATVACAAVNKSVSIPDARCTAVSGNADHSHVAQAEASIEAPSGAPMILLAAQPKTIAIHSTHAMPSARVATSGSIPALTAAAEKHRCSSVEHPDVGLGSLALKRSPCPSATLRP